MPVNRTPRKRWKNPIFLTATTPRVVDQNGALTSSKPLLPSFKEECLKSLRSVREKDLFPFLHLIENAYSKFPLQDATFAKPLVKSSPHDHPSLIKCSRTLRPSFVYLERSPLPSEVDASKVLDEWFPFLENLVIWVFQNVPLRPYAGFRSSGHFSFLTTAVFLLKIEPELKKFLNSASRCVVEAMVRGFIKGGDLRRACHILVLPRDSKRTLDPSLHAKLILEAGRTPNGYKLALALLDDLGERESLELKP